MSQDRNLLFEGLKAAHRRAIYKGTGLDDFAINRPHVGIVNAYTDASPAYIHLRGLADAVRAGILEAGGLPFEFGVFATCGNISVGTEDLKYELVIRDVQAASIEIMASVHHFQGLVLLASSDSIIPGQIMGAARLGLPTIFVTGGPMLAGRLEDRSVVTSDVNEAVFGGLDAGHVTERELHRMEDAACPAAGACPVMGTANTMQILTEALGLSLPGTATIPGVLADKAKAARASGRRIVSLVRDGVTIGKIMDRRALRNAMVVDMAIGGSTNAVLHLLSFARELGIELSLDEFDTVSRQVPCLVSVIPNGRHTVDEFHFAGGVPLLLKRLGGLLELDALTVSGRTVGEEVASVRERPSQVIHPMDRPVFAEGGLAVLRGTLAPEGAIVRQSAMKREMLTHRGTARVFDSDPEGLEAISQKRIQPGDVMVIRYEGPKGAPGMKEVMLCTDALYGRGLDDKISLVTDGRFSGFNRGAIVGHISPEAQVGGPIAIVRDGDMIEINIPKRELNLLVPPDEVRRRLAEWRPKPPKITRGILALYAQTCEPAERGAAMHRFA